MGQQNTKNPPPPLTKIQLDIVCSKVENYIILERDRKIEALFRKEGQLLEYAKKQGATIPTLRNQASANINLLKWINGANMVLQNVKVITNHTLALERGQNNPQEIREMIPSISSIIWATKHLNLAAIQEFNFIINRNFSQVMYQEAQAGKNVDLKLKQNWSGLMPTVFEIDDYLRDFFRRHATDIDEPVRAEYLNQMQSTPHHTSGGVTDPKAPGPQEQTTIISSFQTNPEGTNPGMSQKRSMLGSQLTGENAQKLVTDGNLNDTNMDFLAQLEGLQPDWSVKPDQSGPVNPGLSGPVNPGLSHQTTPFDGSQQPPVNMSHQGSSMGMGLPTPGSFVSHQNSNPSNVAPNSDPFAASYGLQNNTMGSGGQIPHPGNSFLPNEVNPIVSGGYNPQALSHGSHHNEGPTAIINPNSHVSGLQPQLSGNQFPGSGVLPNSGTSGANLQFSGNQLPGSGVNPQFSGNQLPGSGINPQFSVQPVPVPLSGLGGTSGVKSQQSVNPQQSYNPQQSANPQPGFGNQNWGGQTTGNSVNFGSKYNWHYADKLVSCDLDAKLAELRRVGI